MRQNKTRQDRVLVNLSTCFFTSYSWVGRAMGNETFYGDGLNRIFRVADCVLKLSAGSVLNMNTNLMTY